MAERGEGIKSEVEQFLTLKEKLLQELWKDLQNGANLGATLRLVCRLTDNLIVTHKLQGNAALVKELSQQIVQRVNTLFLSNISYQQELQPLMAANILAAALRRSPSF